MGLGVMAEQWGTLGGEHTNSGGKCSKEANFRRDQEALLPNKKLFPGHQGFSEPPLVSLGQRTKCFPKHITSLPTQGWWGSIRTHASLS